MGCCLGKGEQNPTLQRRKVQQIHPNLQPKKKETGEKIADDLNVTFSDLNHIDEHARQAPKSAEQSMDTLATYLAQVAKNDIEMVRAFYVWICENIRYNTEAYFSGNRESSAAEDVLKSKTSVCEGYANVFFNMCQKQNIECKKISGYSKGYSHVIGSVISYDQKTNHAWNVVFIGGKWRFIETTWGSGHVDKNKQFIKEFKDFYFFTRPEHFISDHFPYTENDKEASKQWQLLKSPISLEQFSKSLKLSARARSLGISFPSHQCEVIDINKTDSIRMQSKQYPVHSAKVKLQDSNGTLYDDSTVILKTDTFQYTIMVSPKEPGKYKLNIYGSTEKGNTTMGSLVEYAVNCTSSEQNPLSYPNHSGFYGAKSDIEERGFDVTKLPKSFYTIKDGDLALRIPTKTDLFMSAKMHAADGTDCSDYILIEQLHNDVSVKARFTKKGYYRLILYSGPEEHGSYTEVFNILTVSLATSSVTQSFPKTFSSTFKYKCQLIEPLARQLPSNSEFTFKMSSAILTKLLVSGKSYPKENNDTWNLKLKTGDPGSLKISGKEDDGNSYWGIYVFEIE